MTLSLIERILLLKRAELFSELSRDDLVPLARRAREVRIGRGETFIRRDEAGQHLIVIVDGEAEIVGRGWKVGPRGPGSVIGEMAIIWHRPRSADCVALTDITALRVDHDDFWALLDERPDLALGIIRVLAARLRAVEASGPPDHSRAIHE
jgi:CRP-like cAMP-binding protein